MPYAVDMAGFMLGLGRDEYVGDERTIVVAVLLEHLAAGGIVKTEDELVAMAKSIASKPEGIDELSKASSLFRRGQN